MSWLDTLKAALGMIGEPVTEASPFHGGDPDEAHTAAQVGPNYSRLVGGAKVQRDLQPTAADKARETAAWLYLSNGLGKRVCEINRDWVVGTGMAVEVEPDEADIERRDKKPTLGPDGEPLEPRPVREAVEANDISGRAKKRQKGRQEIVDHFWGDPTNDLADSLYDHVLMLGLFGELLLRVEANPINGHVKLGTIDPGHIQGVILDAFAGGRPFAVDLKGKTPEETPRLKVVQVDEDAASPTYGRRVGAKPGETYRDALGKVREYAGSCFLWQINKIPTAERGVSDLMPVIDYIDALDASHWSELDRQTLAKAFVYDVTLTGATDQQIANRRLELKGDPPKAGTAIVHNEREVWAVPNISLNTWDYTSFVEVMLNHVAASTGIPKHWLSGVIDVNKATATEMAEPTIKRLEARQRFVIGLLEDLCGFALDQAELAGRLPKRRSSPGRLPTAWPLKVTAPEIRTRDMAAAAKALSDASTALTGLTTAAIIDVNAAQEVAVSVIDGLGPKIDLEPMRERLEAGKAEQQQADAEARDAETAAQIAIKKAAPPAPMRRPA